jgi:putative transposase
MSHAKNKVWIHGVFSTKYRKPLITKTIQGVVYENLHLNLKKTGCYLEAMGGIEDHVHILFLLSRSKSISEVFQQLKGGSAHAINQMGLMDGAFHWQVGYAAFSVSESRVQQVVRYIERQEEHHKKVAFDAEWHSLLEKHGLSDDTDSALSSDGHFPTDKSVG